MSCNKPEKIDVVSTIKPIHMLASAIAGKHLHLVQLIPDNASPHHYALKPSNMRQLQYARLILQIDPQLEQFLNKSLYALPASTTHIVLTQLEGIQLHNLNQAESSTHNHNSHPNTDAKVDALKDLHIWLDPNNAIVISRAIANQLKKIDPQHSQDYAHNLQRLITKIQAVDQRLQTQLKPIQQTPILVFHNAWRYFEKHYGIQQLNSINMSAIKQISLSKAQSIQALLLEKQIHCVLDEYHSPSAILQGLAQKHHLKLHTLDVMGSQISPSANSYIELLEQTAEGFLACHS
jgi:zinc transport system substrate-binding protein